MVLAKPMAVTPASSAGSNSTEAASDTVLLPLPAVPSSRNPCAENSRKPSRQSARDMCRMRKFHVSIGNCGRKGSSIPVQSSRQRHPVQRQHVEGGVDHVASVAMNARYP
jgi:hypothetical protein